MFSYTDIHCVRFLLYDKDAKQKMNVELLWRLGEACRIMGEEADTKNKRRKELLTEGMLVECRNCETFTLLRSEVRGSSAEAEREALQCDEDGCARHGLTGRALTHLGETCAGVSV